MDPLTLAGQRSAGLISLIRTHLRLPLTLVLTPLPIVSDYPLQNFYRNVLLLPETIRCVLRLSYALFIFLFCVLFKSFEFNNLNNFSFVISHYIKNKYSNTVFILHQLFFSTSIFYNFFQFFHHLLHLIFVHSAISYSRLRITLKLLQNYSGGSSVLPSSSSSALFTDLPRQHVLTVRMDVPEPWNVQATDAVQVTY